MRAYADWHKGQQMLEHWLLADEKTVVDAREPPFPAAVPHHPVVLRLAQDWARPAHEVEEQESPWDLLSAWDARSWLYDVDQTPIPPT